MPFLKKTTTTTKFDPIGNYVDFSKAGHICDRNWENRPVTEKKNYFYLLHQPKMSPSKFEGNPMIRLRVICDPFWENVPKRAVAPSSALTSRTIF